MKSAKASVADAEKLLADIAPYLLKGDYKSGLVIAKRALKKYPDSCIALYQYAKLLGDWADELPPAKKKAYKKVAAGILKRLTRRMAGQTSAMRFGACLNYYYQAFAYREMYAFGARFMKHDKRKGLYAQALAISGDKAGAMNSLKNAARASSRPVTDWEFKDVLGMIENTGAGKSKP